MWYWYFLLRKIDTVDIRYIPGMHERYRCAGDLSSAERASAELVIWAELSWVGCDLCLFCYFTGTSYWYDVLRIMLYCFSWSTCGRATTAVSRSVFTNWFWLLSTQIRLPTILFKFVLRKTKTDFILNSVQERLSRTPVLTFFRFWLRFRRSMLWLFFHSRKNNIWN